MRVVLLFPKQSAQRRATGRRSAFTLIEVLLVVGIIATLVGILLPAVGRVRKSANAITCASNLRTLGQGMITYATTAHGVLPWEGYAEGDRPERHLGPWAEPSSWFNACPKYAGLQPYHELQTRAAAGLGGLPAAGDRSVFVCPEAGPAAPGPKDDAVDDGYFLMWGLDDTGTAVRRRTYWCYGYNTQLDGGIEDRHTPYRVTISMRQIPNPGETVLLAEKIMRPGEIEPAFTSSVGQQEISYKEFCARHSGGGFILFVDGHVGHLTRYDVLAAPKAPYDYNQPGKILWSPGT